MSRRRRNLIFFAAWLLTVAVCAAGLVGGQAPIFWAVGLGVALLSTIELARTMAAPPVARLAADREIIQS